MPDETPPPDSQGATRQRRTIAVALVVVGLVALGTWLVLAVLLPRWRAQAYREALAERLPRLAEHYETLASCIERPLPWPEQALVWRLFAWDLVQHDADEDIGDFAQPCVDEFIAANKALFGEVEQPDDVAPPETLVHFVAPRLDEGSGQHSASLANIVPQAPCTSLTRIHELIATLADELGQSVSLPERPACEVEQLDSLDRGRNEEQLPETDEASWHHRPGEVHHGRLVRTARTITLEDTVEVDGRLTNHVLYRWVEGEAWERLVLPAHSGWAWTWPDDTAHVATLPPGALPNAVYDVSAAGVHERARLTEGSYAGALDRAPGDSALWLVQAHDDSEVLTLARSNGGPFVDVAHLPERTDDVVDMLDLRATHTGASVLQWSQDDTTAWLHHVSGDGQVDEVTFTRADQGFLRLEQCPWGARHTTVGADEVLFWSETGSDWKRHALPDGHTPVTLLCRDTGVLIAARRDADLTLAWCTPESGCQVTFELASLSGATQVLLGPQGDGYRLGLGFGLAIILAAPTMDQPLHPVGVAPHLDTPGTMIDGVLMHGVSFGAGD